MFRFHPKHTYFEYGMTVPPLMSREDAAPLIGQRDKASLDKLTVGHSWLVFDIAGRALHKMNLPAYLGEELASVGLKALVEAVPRLTKKVRNVSAYLSAAIDNAIGDFLLTDSLCYVPPRTQRNLAAKGKPLAVAPKITTAVDMPKDDYDLSAHQTDELLSCVRRRPCRYRLGAIEDMYEYCEDDADRDIVYLRYDDGAGPRCMEEVADLAGVTLGEVDRRLKRIENRVYKDFGWAKPKKKRSPGKRIFAVVPKRAALVR